MLLVKMLAAICSIAFNDFESLQDVKYRILSYAVATGMTQGAVEKIMGMSSSTADYGPPGEFITVYSYGSIQVTFDSTGRVQDVSR